MTWEELNNKLIEAVKTGRMEDVKHCLAAGAEINATDNYGSTPLTEASCHDHEHILEFLLKQGADPNIADGGDWTAMTYACYYRRNLKIIRMLLEAGADINLKNIYGDTLLSNICRDARNKKKIVAILLSFGADPNIISEDSETALMRLARRGHTGLMKALIRHGADITIKNHAGNTALDILRMNCRNKYDKWIFDSVTRPRKDVLEKEDGDLPSLSMSTPDYNI